MKTLLFLFLPFIVFAQSINDNLPDFNKIAIDCNAKTHIRFSDKFSLKIDGRQQILDNIKYEIIGNTLVIEYKEKESFFSFFKKTDNSTVEIEINLKNLKKT
jgi:hypothetical protein